MNTNETTKKYVAVTEYNGYNDFVSPYCSTIQEVEDYLKVNKIYCDAIHPIINHSECKNALGYK